jgi:RNA polymerase sigma factor (sigma-70 family)
MAHDSSAAGGSGHWPARGDQLWQLLAQRDVRVAAQVQKNVYRLTRQYLPNLGCKPHLVRQEADDVTQSVMVLLMTFDPQRLRSPDAEPDTIVRGMIRNVWLELRRLKAGHLHVDPETLDLVDRPDGPIWGVGLTRQEAMVLALEFDLRPNCHAILNLKYFEEYTYTEIGSRLEMTLDAVGKQLLRCRQYLVKAMNKRFNAK